MSESSLCDLDQHPECTEAVLNLFRSCPPGRDHAVIGMPARMGQRPSLQDLDDCLGVLLEKRGDTVVGTLGICGYSDQQVTLWGPVIHRGHLRKGLGSRMLSEARSALRDGDFESIRVLVDTRNRDARAFFLANGLTPWKDNLIYERRIAEELATDSSAGVSLAKPSDHEEIAELLRRVFPESGHLERSIAEREQEGYRHHILQSGGTIIAIAAVRRNAERSWLSLLAVSPDHRQSGHGRTLVTGTLKAEYRLGARAIGLEVLADNRAAQNLYNSCGFEHKWTATIMTGPV